MKINILEPKIFNRIAAGEVVERPASVVKELVENSIDAGATEVTIEIFGGGIEKIKVTDNGCGIEYDQLKNAFLPHATSKISCVEDLTAIKTLGFRGEALASIGAVSEVTLVSKTKNSDTAGMIEISGGAFSDVLPTSHNVGTCVCMNNLFFNVPARAKFLKKPKTEEGEITNIISRFILANPCVSFKYFVDGKLVYSSLGRGIEDAMLAIYGKDIKNNLLYFENDYGYIKLYGFIGKPSYTKPNKTYQTLVVNNRYIINATVASAIHNAYGAFLMKRQFPFYVIYLDIDYNVVDVNVHPNKLDIRFENSGAVYAKVFECINRKLNSVDAVAKYDFSNIASGNDEKKENFATNSSESLQTKMSQGQNQSSDSTRKSNEQVALFGNKNDSDNNTSDEESSAFVYKYGEIGQQNSHPETKETIAKRREIFASLSTLNNDKSELNDNITLGSKLLNQMNKSYEEDIIKTQAEETTSGEFGVLPRIVGTIFKTYILVQYKEDFLIIDQHAGHERLLFDKLVNEMEIGELALQPLLIPYILKTNAIENNFISENIQTLRNMGILIDEFGMNSFKISEVPAILSNIDLSFFFNEILADTKILKQSNTSDFLKDKLASAACKAAVKGGDELNRVEIDTLLSAFTKSNTTMLCPHGRPVIVKFTRKEIEKMFKRIV